MDLDLGWSALRGSFGRASAVLLANNHQSLVDILGESLPQYPFLNGFILLAGLGAIMGTIHSMLWSASCLLRDTLHKTPSSFSNNLLKKGLGGLDYCVCICALFMTISFLSLESDTILSITVCFIALSYVLSLISF